MTNKKYHGRCLINSRSVAWNSHSQQCFLTCFTHIYTCYTHTYINPQKCSLWLGYSSMLSKNMYIQHTFSMPKNVRRCFAWENMQLLLFFIWFSWVSCANDQDNQDLAATAYFFHLGERFSDSFFCTWNHSHANKPIRKCNSNDDS